MNLQKLIFYIAGLGIITLVFGAIYSTVQQDLRQSANDPQIQMAEDAAVQLNLDANPQIVVPVGQVDLKQSLAPFVVIYDDTGKPVVSSGYLNGNMPIPPKGVFDFVRQFGEERVTWQPQADVRIASVIVRYNSGFVLAGRSLREVERRENKTFLIAVLGWLGSVALLVLAAYFLRKN